MLSIESANPNQQLKSCAACVCQQPEQQPTQHVAEQLSVTCSCVSITRKITLATAKQNCQASCTSHLGYQPTSDQT
jgi:hypothetical protein